YEQGGETEQLTRALRCEASGRAICLREADLNPHALADAVSRALALPKMQPDAGFGGAARTAQLLLSALARTY
ncbi:MAG: glycosyl transferase, partial [Luteolibacter sp.]